MSGTVENAHGAPVRDEDSAVFWEGLEQHEIRVQQCTSCGTQRCPPLPACHVCGATGCRWTTSSGEGVVYSWIVARRPVGTLAAGEPPVAFATVELEHGCRLVGRLLDDEAPWIGAAVTVAFVDHPDWTELAFRPAGEGT